MIIEFDGEAWSQFEELLRRYAEFHYTVRLHLDGWKEPREVQLKGVRGVRDDRDETVLLYQKFNEDVGEGSGEVFEVNFDLVEYVYVY